MRLKVAFTNKFVLPLPENHRFPMEKYDLIPEQLIFEGTLNDEHFFKPRPVQEEALLLTHSQKYIERLKSKQLSSHEERKIGFPFNSTVIEREYLITGGTVHLCE
jgi:acetoin utilization deacetylase AcuC-like enzyme